MNRHERRKQSAVSRRRNKPMAQQAQNIQLKVVYGYNVGAGHIYMNFSQNIPNFIMTESQCEAAIANLQDALAKFRGARAQIQTAAHKPPATQQ